MENEIWKDVPGWEGFYQISNQGSVKSMKRTRTDACGRVFTTHEKILKPRLCRGYYIISFYRASIYVNKRINVLVAESFRSDYKPGMIVNHNDGNKLNNHYTNLIPGTHLDNLIHALDTGLRKTKLSKNDVLAINADRSTKGVDLARMFGTCTTMVARIRKGNAYKRYLNHIL